jgi:hypothetical protein
MEDHDQDQTIVRSIIPQGTTEVLERDLTHVKEGGKILAPTLMTVVRDITTGGLDLEIVMVIVEAGTTNALRNPDPLRDINSLAKYLSNLAIFTRVRL